MDMEENGRKLGSMMKAWQPLDPAKPPSAPISNNLPWSGLWTDSSLLQYVCHRIQLRL